MQSLNQTIRFILIVQFLYIYIHIKFIVLKINTLMFPECRLSNMAYFSTTSLWEKSYHSTERIWFHRKPFFESEDSLPSDITKTLLNLPSENHTNVMPENLVEISIFYLFISYRLYTQNDHIHQHRTDIIRMNTLVHE